MTYVSGNILLAVIAKSTMYTRQARKCVSEVEIRYCSTYGILPLFIANFVAKSICTMSFL